MNDNVDKERLPSGSVAFALLFQPRYTSVLSKQILQLPLLRW